MGPEPQPGHRSRRDHKKNGCAAESSMGRFDMREDSERVVIRGRLARNFFASAKSITIDVKSASSGEGCREVVAPDSMMKHKKIRVRGI